MADNRPIPWLLVPLLLAATGEAVAGQAAAAAAGLDCRHKGGTNLPDFRALHSRTNPALHAAGLVIKGIYFAREAGGPNELVLFWLGCDGRLESGPFLSFEFATAVYLLDLDGDGCADGAGSLASGEIDPGDFLASLPPSRRECAGRNSQPGAGHPG